MAEEKAQENESASLQRRQPVEVSPEAKERSLEAKSRGDDAFRRKDFLVAVDAYTQLDLSNDSMDQTINGFFKMVAEDMNRKGKTEMLCLCKNCKTVVLIHPFTSRVKMYLLKHDFMTAYTQWTRLIEDEEDVVSNIEGETDEEAANPFDEEPEGGNDQVLEHEEDHQDGHEG